MPESACRRGREASGAGVCSSARARLANEAALEGLKAGRTVNGRSGFPMHDTLCICKNVIKSIKM